jgi:hypothetical protein
MTGMITVKRVELLGQRSAGQTSKWHRCAKRDGIVGETF